MNTMGVALLAGMTLLGCHGGRKGAAGSAADKAGASDVPHALVYRTRTDTRALVPVTLSPERDRITAYPHPKDVDPVAGTPLELGDGYLLDRRGITLNSAFLRTTYAEYAALAEAPSLESMMQQVDDRDPITELCDCGQRTAYKDLGAELRAIVAAKELDRRCKRLR